MTGCKFGSIIRIQAEGKEGGSLIGITINFANGGPKGRRSLLLMGTEELLRIECIRRLEEGLGRIHKCIGMMADYHVWHRPNQHVVSVGNLILHLAGNVGQWINATLGEQKDARIRSAEFEEKGPLDRVQLMQKLDRTMQQAKITIKALPLDAFARIYKVQGFEESGTGILLHVVEHFSYHVGQITLHTKLMLDTGTGYYEGRDLDLTNK